MLETLTLTNFRQHRSLTMQLTAGLNVLRGANEAGKSTILEAMAYAFYGARSLREPLEDTVTWGEAASSLKVELRFSFDGIPGYVRRSKSGAEVKYGETVASGQSEVTDFFERLFGVNAKMAANLQIASQNKVRGAVEGGTAVSLIEALADFSLLESIVDKVQNTKPCGNTNIVSDRLQRLKDAQAAPIPAEPSRLDIERAQGHLRTLEGTLAGQQQALAAVASALPGAQAAIREAEAVEGRRAVALSRKSTLELELAKPLPQVTADVGMVAEWRAAQVAEATRARRRKHYETAEPKCSKVWSGTRESFLAEQQALMERKELLTRSIQALQVEYAGKAALKINEQVCSFCKKSLADVPEVAQLNAQTDAALVNLSTDIALKQSDLAKTVATLADLNLIAVADAQYPGLFSSEYWTLDTASIPRIPVWKGEVPKAEADQTDYSKLIMQAEDSAKAQASAVGRRNALQEELLSLEAAIDAPKLATAGFEAILADHATRSASVSATTLEMANSKAGIKLLEQRYEHEVQFRQQALKAAEAARLEVEATTKELADMAFYNELIRKVRAARPAVANKLWALVMAAVSHYTTMGRGTPSTVTRDGDGFKINGKSVDAYSGSAQDVLGLAVRLALVKTFLPNSPFMIMDEIASACDDDRELDMLGMVLAADIPQVLLVTHSDAAESFATNLVQI